MAITALSTTGFSQYVTSSSNLSKLQRTLQPLQQSLASGDLSAAKTALTTYQNLNQNLLALSEGSSSSSSQLSKDLNSLGSALDAGDLTAAQKTFAIVKSDLKTSQSEALTNVEKAAAQTVQWVNDLFNSSTSSSSSSNPSSSNPMDAATAILETAYGLNLSSNKADPMVAFLESKYGIGNTGSTVSTGSTASKGNVNTYA
jgi:hypothetical protein